MIVCDKIPYDEYKGAKSHISGLVQRRGGSYKIYKCKECGKFHVTSAPKNGKKLKPLKEKNFIIKPRPIPKKKIKFNQNPNPPKRGVQESIITTYRPFEHFTKKTG